MSAEPIPPPEHIRWADLPADDAASLTATIAQYPWSPEVFAVFRRADGALVLHLGTQTGPYSGGGDVVVAERVEGGWKMERIDFWVL